MLLVSALVILVYGVIQGGNTNDWLSWDSIGAIVLGAVAAGLLRLPRGAQRHPTIDVHLFRNRQFAAGSAAIAFTFFALMGATFYLAYFMQAVRGYTPLAAGVALIAVAGGMILFAPRSAKLSERFGARMVTGTGMTLFGAGDGHVRVRRRDHAAVGHRGADVRHGIRHGPDDGAGHQRDHERGAAREGRRGLGGQQHRPPGRRGARGRDPRLGPRRRRSAAGIGPNAPANLAAKLDQPAAVVAQLPADTKVSTYVRSDSSQSIGNAFDFVANAGKALERRGQLPQAGGLSAGADRGPEGAGDADINSFVSDSKSSFVDAMGIASIVAAIIAWIGAAHRVPLPAQAPVQHGRASRRGAGTGIATRCRRRAPRPPRTDDRGDRS